MNELMKKYNQELRAAAEFLGVNLEIVELKVYTNPVRGTKLVGGKIVIDGDEYYVPKVRKWSECRYEATLRMLDIIKP